MASGESGCAAPAAVRFGETVNVIAEAASAGAAGNTPFAGTGVSPGAIAFSAAAVARDSVMASGREALWDPVGDDVVNSAFPGSVECDSPAANGDSAFAGDVDESEGEAKDVLGDIGSAGGADETGSPTVLPFVDDATSPGEAGDEETGCAPGVENAAGAAA